VAGKVYIEQSGIHGMGLFAGDEIKEGEVIGRIAPVPVLEDGPHVLWVSEDQGYRVDGPLKYINHSVEPNACYYDDLTVVALQDIAAGDEITHHYGNDWLAD
jgi:SET domain-containing protein